MTSKRRATRSRPSHAPWLASIAVVVSDNRKARLWYTRKLGFQVLAKDDHWVTVGRRGLGAMLHLCEYPERGKVELEPGNSGILLLVRGDLARQYDQLRDRGVDVSPPEDHPWGKDMTLRDPDGNEFLMMEG